MKNGEFRFMMMQSYLNCLFYQKHWVNSVGPPFLAKETLSGELINCVPVVFMSCRNIVSLSLAELCIYWIFLGRELFDNFDPASIAKFSEKKILSLVGSGSALLSEPKLRAIVENARQILKVWILASVWVVPCITDRHASNWILKYFLLFNDLSSVGFLFFLSAMLVSILFLETFLSSTALSVATLHSPLSKWCHRISYWKYI